MLAGFAVDQYPLAVRQKPSNSLYARWAARIDGSDFWSLTCWVVTWREATSHNQFPEPAGPAGDFARDCLVADFQQWLGLGVVLQKAPGLDEMCTSQLLTDRSEFTLL